MMPYGKKRRRSYSRKGPRPIVKDIPSSIRGEPEKPASFFARVIQWVKGLFS